MHQISFQLINTLNSSLASYHAQNPILGDVSLQVILHIISCTSALRDVLDSSKSKSEVQTHLFMPFVNGLLATMGKVIMESFTFEPKALDVLQYSTSYHLILRHTLRLFPEMTSKRHKSSGKVLLHHAVFKARPAVAVETVKLLLVLSPQSVQLADSTGALPLHWATRNEDLPVEVIDLLVAANPGSAGVTDSKGFLPLHWAVNQDQPNVEVIRRLLKIHPKAASTPSSSGSLPLHYCVSREKPHPAVIKALMAAFPDGIRYRCEEGCLPLHRFLQRSRVDMDILRQLVNFFPDGLLITNIHKQTPLHLALDQPEVCDEAIAWLIQQCPLACSVQDQDGYHPLHMLLDHPHPNYSLAEEMVQYYPTAVGNPTNDMLLPLHLVLSINSQPSLPFLLTLLRAFPRAIDREVQDMVPAVDGEIMSDPESWSGEWVERVWKPIDRARERGLSEVATLLEEIQRDPNLLHTKYAHSSHRTAGSGMAAGPNKGLTIGQQPALATVPSPVMGDGSLSSSEGEGGGVGGYRPMAKFAMPSTSTGATPAPGGPAGALPPPQRFVSPSVGAGGGGGAGVHIHHPHVQTTGYIDGPSPKEKSDILPFDSVDVFSPTTRTPSSHPQSGAPPSLLVGNYVSGSLATSAGIVQPATFQIQPQIHVQPSLPAQTSPSSHGPEGPANALANNEATVTSPVAQPGSASGGNRPPPSGPIPTSLLQAAENNAMRLSRAQYDFLKGKKTTTKKKKQQQGSTSGNSLDGREGTPGGGAGWTDAADPAESLDNVSAILSSTAPLPTVQRSNNDSHALPTRAATAMGSVALPSGGTESGGGIKIPSTAPLPPTGDDNLSVSSAGTTKKPSPNPQNFIKKGTNKLVPSSGGTETAGISGSSAAGGGGGGGGSAAQMASSVGGKGFATNHTAEIMRSLGGGGGGGRRVHPMSTGTDAV